MPVLFYTLFMIDILIPFVLAVVVALVFGLALGWLAWGRGRAVLQHKIERLGLVEAEREALRQEAAQANLALAGFTAGQIERERAHAEQLKQLEVIKAELTRQFETSAGLALAASQERFFQLANEKFGDHQQQAGQQLSGLIGPVTEQLRRAEDKIDALEKARIHAYGSLTEQISAMRAGQEKVQAEAARLSSALRSSSKLRGSWGEQQLRNVLEMAGLSPYADFRTEVSVEGDEGRLRPDVIVRMPGGRQLVIDAKTSLAAFQMAVECDDEITRRMHLAAHARSLKDHAGQLGRKKYWEQFADAPDFVVMFVPGEHFLSAAMETDPELWEFAYAQRILIASPINLIALAKTVAQLWRQEKMTQTAQEIGAAARELYKRMIKLGEHIEKVGSNLDKTVRAYNGFVGSLESSVLPQARKFSELDVEGADIALAAGQQIESAVRVPVAGRDLKLIASQDD